jgi:S1-C subfamily serine protease
MTSAERTALGIEGNVGIFLTDIYEGGPAAAADLRQGDVIIDINGEAIFSLRQAQLLVAGASPGDKIELVGIRDGERFTATVVATERPGPVE